MADLDGLAAAVEAGDRGTATRLTQEAVDEGLDPRGILAVMTASMRRVGDRFQRSEIYIPEMLIAARAMKESAAILEPQLTKAGVRPAFTAIIGTVQGDLHDIGKSLVGMMWRGAAIEVIDLGTNVAPERFVAAAREHDARVIGLSALLTTTMVGMKEVVAAVRAADLAGVKVIVGGAPVTAEFAAQIGADAYAPDAATAVQAVKQLVGPAGSAG